VERIKLAKGIDQSLGEPSGGSNERSVVQSNPWYNTHTGTAACNSSCTYGSMSRVQRIRHSVAPGHGLWYWQRAVEMDKTTFGSDVKDGSAVDSRGMVYRPQSRMWMPQRHKAELWLLAKLVDYRTQRGKNLDNP
jgi:hypothetical protein